VSVFHSFLLSAAISVVYRRGREVLPSLLPILSAFVL